ncbi:hypothetical protein JHK85_033372 [Glycine max]|nr:hypothetical protein JHK85_033372 [Glycine max]
MAATVSSAWSKPGARVVGFGSSGGADSDNWNTKKGESNVGSESVGGRPKLVLQPRTVSVSDEGVDGNNAGKPKGVNPFGEARPREQVLAEKGQDWKKIDEQLESVKIKEASGGDGFGKRGFGSSNGGGGRATLPESRTERSWRKPQFDDDRPKSAEKVEDEPDQKKEVEDEHNPYVESGSPCGSSSGSSIAVATNMVTISLGTETDGSIICPAHHNSVVGLKPTVGLTSRAGVIPVSPRQDTIGFASVLIVSVKLKDFELCRQIHGQVLVVGFLSNVVISSLIVDAYAKCGKMENARRLFDDMPVRDVRAWTTLVSGYAVWGDMESGAELFSQMPKSDSCSWTSLIRGYARNGMGYEALGVFKQMIKHQVRPDQFTLSTCLFACATIASLKHGRQIHAFLVLNNIKPNTIVVCAIVNMYSKCGSLETARRVFNFIGNKQDVVLWNTMILALAHYGYGIEAIMMLYNMLKIGVKPNKGTFVGILNACCHSGLVQEGLQLFKSMTSEHGVVPDQEHYTRLANLLGQARCFNESVKDLQMMDCKPGDHVCNSSIGVCRMHGNIDHGAEVAAFLIKLQPQSSAAYELLSRTYAALGKWELVEKNKTYFG